MPSICRGSGCQRRPVGIVCWEQPSAPTKGKNWDAHEDLGKFGTHQLSTWFLSTTAVLEVLAKHLSVPWEKLDKLAQERRWLADLEPAQSMVMDVLWSQLVRYWGGAVESVATSSPCDLSTVLHWRTAMRMLAELPEEQRSQVSGASLVHGLPRRPTRAWVVDGHCHLELLRQWVSIYDTVESTFLYFMHEHRSSVIEGLEAVVSNQVSRAECEATFSHHRWCSCCLHMVSTSQGFGRCELEVAGGEDVVNRVCHHKRVWLGRDQAKHCSPGCCLQAPSLVGSSVG